MLRSKITSSAVTAWSADTERAPFVGGVIPGKTTDWTDGPGTISGWVIESNGPLSGVPLSERGVE